MFHSPTSTDVEVMEARPAYRRFCSRSTSSSQSLAINTANTYSLSKDWRIAIYPTVESGLEDWARITSQENNLFTSDNYLQLLEELQLGGIQNGLAIFHHSGSGSFGLILQVFSFVGREQLGNLTTLETDNNWQKVGKSMRRGMANLLNFRVITAGQLLLTGHHHGVVGLSQCDIASQDVLARIIDEGLDQVVKHWPQRIHGILLKDLPLAETPRNLGYHPLPVQPNMWLPIREDWSSFNDYTADMSSKYRVRARRARKKGKSLERRLLSLADVIDREEEMYRLFQQVVNDAEFTAFELPTDYFVRWIKSFPEEVEIIGYFDEEKLIGFTTTIQNGTELEAHFLGLEPAYNRSHQLYLNMLYDMIEKSITIGAAQLIFARTALEIKSSVGAVPEELPCWLRGRKRWSNALIPLIAPYVAPPAEWTQRRPFKQSKNQ